MATLNPREARRARASRHATRSHTAPCGREVWGNGGLAAHQNRCETCLTKDGAYMPQWVREAILSNMHWPASGVEILAAYKEWQRAEGDRLLAERAKPAAG